MTRSRTSSEPSKARALARYLPGAIGAACIVAGAAAIWWPLGLVVFGAFCLLVDRRL